MTPMPTFNIIDPSEAQLAQILPPLPTREQIEQLATVLLEIEQQEAPPDMPPAHYFAGEVYGRSIHIPAGTILVGLPHRADHLCVCVGDITVWTEDGRRRITGAEILTGRAGRMRVGFAHTDTTWLAVHSNPGGSQDVTAVEDSLTDDAKLLLSRRLLEAKT